MHFNPELVLTQILDNNIAVLDSLRREAANANSYALPEVRLPGHPATELLSGVELPVNYAGLVSVINHMKLGQAHRRMSIEDVL